MKALTKKTILQTKKNIIKYNHMEALSNSTVNTTQNQALNGGKTSTEVISLKETPVKSDSKEDSNTFISDTPISFKDSTSKKLTNKEKKVFQKSSKKRNVVKIPENSSEVKEIPSVVVDVDALDNPALTIEINEEEKNMHSPKKRGRKKKEEKIPKSDGKEKPSILRGYNPFIFYEKEKFKEINVKEINQREYVKQISAEWKKMTDEEKEPYLKMAIEFTNNMVAQNGEGSLIAKKRKKTKKKGKKEMKEEKEDDEGNEEKDGEESKVHVKKNKKKKSDSIPNSVDEKKIKNVKCDVDDDNYDDQENNGELFNNSDFVKSVVVPFVEKSYEYFTSKGIIKNQK